jgi:hypothetical protein
MMMKICHLMKLPGAFKVSLLGHDKTDDYMSVSNVRNRHSKEDHIIKNTQHFAIYILL